MTGFLVGAALVTGGLAVGIMASTVIGIVPYMLAQPYGGYVRLVQFMWPRYDPIMPALNGVTLVLDVLLAALFAGTPASRAGFAAAAVLLLAVMAISITKNVPVNKFVKGLDPAEEPPEWERVDPRRRWRRWNLIRCSLALVAFVVNAATAAALV